MAGRPLRLDDGLQAAPTDSLGLDFLKRIEDHRFSGSDRVDHPGNAWDGAAPLWIAFRFPIGVVTHE